MPINVGSFLPDRVGNLPMVATTTISVDSLPTDQSDTTESDLLCSGPAKVDSSVGVVDSTSGSLDMTSQLTLEAWREGKPGREMLSRTFPIDIDELFTLLFTNSRFFYDFQVGPIGRQKIST